MNVSPGSRDKRSLQKLTVNHLGIRTLLHRAELMQNPTRKRRLCHEDRRVPFDYAVLRLETRRNRLGSRIKMKSWKDCVVHENAVILKAEWSRSLLPITIMKGSWLTAAESSVCGDEYGRLFYGLCYCSPGDPKQWTSAWPGTIPTSRSPRTFGGAPNGFWNAAAAAALVRAVAVNNSPIGSSLVTKKATSYYR